MAAIAPLFTPATATSNNASDVAADNTALEPLPLPVLRLERLRFGCEALDPIRLPSYSGSAWRGLLGQSLRHSVCVTRAPTCEGCLLRQQCAYSTFFESPAPPAQATQRYRVLPHPFVLEPPAPGQREHAPGERLSLGLTLIGPAAELLPYLIHTLQRAGERGLGRERGRFRLLEVLQETRPGSDDWQPVFETRVGRLNAFRSEAPRAGPLPDPAPGSSPSPASLPLALLTPLRIKQRGHYVRPHQLDARALLGTLATRIERLGALYGTSGPEEGFERAALHAAIDQVQVETVQLRWVEWTRYSSRQRTTMQLGGLLGTLQLNGPGLAPLWPLIALGQWLHLGKNTSFGLGRYRLLATGDAER